MGFFEHILEPVGAFVINTISTLGYWGVVICMAIESACIPLPSEIIMPFSGYLVSTGQFNLWLTGLAGAVGCLVGSVVAYAVGYWGGRPFVERYGKWVLISPRELEWADRWFERYGGAAVFFSRLLPIIRTFISLPAGIARMPFIKFCVYSFVGSFPWCLGLTYVGFVMGENWTSLRKYFHKFDIVIAAVLIAGFAVWVYLHFKHLRRNTRDEAKNV
jgi:membrane protein DedA with SNARE-associated domain